MKNKTAIMIMALGLALPAEAFGQNSDVPTRPPVKRLTQRKMTGADQAQPGAPVAAVPGASRQRSTPPVIAAVDANHDGVLDAAEIAQASEALRKLDRNGDGTLAADELRPPRPSRSRPTPATGPETGTVAPPNQQPPVRSRLGAVDANKDGVIDAAEISGASQVLAQLDRDGDGKITLEEVRSHRAPRTSARMNKE